MTEIPDDALCTRITQGLGPAAGCDSESRQSSWTILGPVESVRLFPMAVRRSFPIPGRRSFQGRTWEIIPASSRRGCCGEPAD
jgi:hypothetical protein